MTPEKLDRDSLSQLYALAKKASIGDWYSSSQASDGIESWGDSCYIAAASPDVVTALIDRVRELEGALKIAQKFCNSHSAEDCPDEVAIPINLAVDKDYYK